MSGRGSQNPTLPMFLFVLLLSFLSFFGFPGIVLRILLRGFISGNPHLLLLWGCWGLPIICRVSCHM